LALNFRVETQGSLQILFLNGDVDENADFSKISLNPGGALAIDLKGIRHLNSLGLRNWLFWSKTLKYPDGLVLRNCPNAVMNQINILSGFLPMHAIVESLEVPFWCESCGHRFSYMAQRSKDYMEATTDEAAKVLMSFHQKCPACSAEADADILPQKHFRFLKM